MSVTTPAIPTSMLSTLKQRQADLSQLRETTEQLVGVAFFEPLLKMSQNSALKGTYGHGGRAEEMFMSQRNVLFAEQVASSQRLEVSEALYRQLAKRYENTVTVDSARSNRPMTQHWIG